MDGNRGGFLIGIAVIALFIICLLIGVKAERERPQKQREPKNGGIRLMNRFIKIVNKITGFFNIIAVAALIVMLLLVCANVLMRYIFKNPIPGTYELTQSLMICLTPCIAVNIMAKQCVWVDVFTSKLGRIGQMVVDIITLPLSTVVIGVMAWQGFNMILTSMEKGTYSAVMNFRLLEWPFRLVYFIAMATATLAALAFTIERFTQYKDGGVPVDKNEVDRAIEEVGDLSTPAAQDTENEEGGVEA